MKSINLFSQIKIFILKYQMVFLADIQQKYFRKCQKLSFFLAQNGDAGYE